MQLTGTITQINEVITGTGTNGAWKNQTFIVAFKDGNYDKEVAFKIIGDKADQLTNLGPGMPVTVDFVVSSREYNGKWYTDATAWKVVATAPHDIPF